MDKIFIHTLKTEAIVGIFDWERQVKQTVVIDLELSADIRKAALTDSIEDTLNYKAVAKRVLGFVEASQFHLVETLAEHVAMLVLEQFGVQSVSITLSKPGAIRNSKDVGVKLERSRADLETWRTHVEPAARCCLINPAHRNLRPPPVPVSPRSPRPPVLHRRSGDNSPCCFATW